MLTAQLGESANELAARWKSGPRGGRPDFLAIEPSIRAYNYDRSRIVTGVIGLHGRKWMYDQNLALDNPAYAGPHPGDVTFYAGPLGDKKMLAATRSGLGSGTFTAGTNAQDIMVPPDGRYLASIKRIPSCANAPGGAQVGVTCIAPALLAPGETSGVSIDWEAPIESPTTWLALGGSAIVGGLIGALIGVVIGKRHAR